MVCFFTLEVLFFTLGVFFFTLSGQKSGPEEVVISLAAPLLLLCTTTIFYQLNLANYLILTLIELQMYTLLVMLMLKAELVV